MSRTTTEPKDSCLKIRLPEELKKRLEAEAKKSGETLSEHIREILKKSAYGV